MFEGQLILNGFFALSHYMQDKTSHKKDELCHYLHR